MAKYWPEFAQNGKESILVKDVLRHEGGLCEFYVSPSAEDIRPEGIKRNAVGKIIEGMTP